MMLDILIVRFDNDDNEGEIMPLYDGVPLSSPKLPSVMVLT